MQNRQNGLHFTCESTETTKKDSVETENFLKSYDLPLVSRCHLGEKVEVRKFFQKEIQTSFLPQMKLFIIGETFSLVLGKLEIILAIRGNRSGKNFVYAIEIEKLNHVRSRLYCFKFDPTLFALPHLIIP